MIELLSTKENLSNFFRYWVNLYDKKRFPNFEGVYQFVLEEGEEAYYFYLSVSEGKAEHGEGKHTSPSLTIYSPVSVWFDVASGRLNGFWGWLTKKYRIKGPIYYLTMLGKVFGKGPDDSEMPGTGDRIQDFEIPEKRVWEKPDNVLIINGSPRQKNGFTYFYLQYLIKGIKQTGTEIEIVDIYDTQFNIEPCQGCFTCWTKTEGKCMMRDDANQLIEKVSDAHLTIYAMPLYVCSVPAKLKAFLDRCFVGLMGHVNHFVEFLEGDVPPSWHLDSA